MQVLKTIAGLRCYLEQQRATGATVGLVPTMGALHDGHLSLIRRACQENAVVVVSIFVNPTQFGPGEDLARYPQDLDRDQRLCEQMGVDAVFAPTVSALYGSESPSPATLTQVVPPQEMMAVLCGPVRPGHFQGVATVVLKLLNLVQPHRAYFGRKDAQQLAILRRLVKDLNLAVTLVGCPIVRDQDGLALSSRNQYLTAVQRQQATALFHGLKAAKIQFQRGKCDRTALVAAVEQVLDATPDIEIDYVDLVHPYSLKPLETVDTVGLLAMAARLGKTRLIDNMLLRSRQPIIAIDGPAGAGKSTVARLVAKTLGLLYLDTGAMYRAITWQVLNLGLDPEDAVRVAELAAACTIRLASGDGNQPPQVWIDEVEVTDAIRSPDVTAQVSTIAAQPAVRQALLQQQQDYGLRGGVVMEGRDIGTHVFPDAEVKIFLTASVQERARRRQKDLLAQNQPDVSLTELEQTIQDRDRKDSTRAVAPLQQAADAVELITDGLTIPQVAENIVQVYRQTLQPAAGR